MDRIDMSIESTRDDSHSNQPSQPKLLHYDEQASGYNLQVQHPVAIVGGYTTGSITPNAGYMQTACQSVTNHLVRLGGYESIEDQSSQPNALEVKTACSTQGKIEQRLASSNLKDASAHYLEKARKQLIIHLDRLEHQKNEPGASVIEAHRDAQTPYRPVIIQSDSNVRVPDADLSLRQMSSCIKDHESHQSALLHDSANDCRRAGLALHSESSTSIREHSYSSLYHQHHARESPKVVAPEANEDESKKNNANLQTSTVFAESAQTIEEHKQMIENSNVSDHVRPLSNFPHQQPDKEKDSESQDKDAYLPRQLEEELKQHDWDYVIVMPNPEFGRADEDVDVSEAEILYRNAFHGEETLVGGVSLQHEHSQLERHQFLRTFKTLKSRARVGRDRQKQTAPLLKPGAQDDTSRHELSQVQDRSLFLAFLKGVLGSKLCDDLGLSIDVVPSSDNVYIYILVAADESLLKRHAERVAYSLLVDTNNVDKRSYEPCHHDLGPVIESLFAAGYPDVRETYERYVHALHKQASEEPGEARERLLAYHHDQLHHLQRRYKHVETNSSLASGAEDMHHDGTQTQALTELDSNSYALLGDVAIHGRSNRKPSKINGTYKCLQKGHDGKPVYVKADGKFLFYSAQTSRWIIADSPDIAENDGYAFALAHDGGASPPVNGARWHVFDGKRTGYNLDIDVHCDFVDALEETFQRYLKKRINGVDAFSAIQETNLESKPVGSKSANLLCLWDRIGFDLPPSFATKYDQAAPQHIWQHYRVPSSVGRNTMTLFTDLDRKLLIDNLIASAIDLKYLLWTGYVADYFPLGYKSNMSMKEEINRCLPIWEPRESLVAGRDSRTRTLDGKISISEACCSTNRMHDWITTSASTYRVENMYFGSDIATYLCFLRYSTKSLLLLGCLGAFIHILTVGIPERKNQFALLYVFLMILWASLWLMFWHTTHRRNMLHCGIAVFTPESHIMRDLREDAALFTHFFVIWFHRVAAIMSWILALLISVLLIALVSILRHDLIHEACQLDGYNFSQHVVALANTVLIRLVNRLFCSCAFWIAKNGPRCGRNSFVDFYCLLSVLFRFVNSFASLLYITAIREVFEIGYLKRPWSCPRDEERCSIYLLQINLWYLLLVPWFGSMCHFCILCSWREVQRRRAMSLSSLSDIDRQRAKPHYGWDQYGCDGTIDDYLEVAINLGYVVMFSVAVPVISALVFIRFLLKAYIDTFKLRFVFCRPLPKMPSAEQWSTLFHVMVLASAVTNSIVLAAYSLDDLKLAAHLIHFDFLSKSSAVTAFAYAVPLMSIKACFSIASREESHIRVARRRMQHMLRLLKEAQSSRLSRRICDPVASLKVRKPVELSQDGWHRVEEESLHNPEKSTTAKLKGKESRQKSVQFNTRSRSAASQGTVSHSDSELQSSAEPTPLLQQSLSSMPEAQAT